MTHDPNVTTIHSREDRLRRFSDPELVEAVRRWTKLMADAAKEQRRNPGPGWDPVNEMFAEDLKALNAEIERRMQAREA